MTKQMRFWRTEAEPPVSLHGYDSRGLGKAIATSFVGSKSLVQQQYGSEVDINTIVRRFGVTRELPPGVGAGVYGDFTGFGDLVSITDVREMMERAESSFMLLKPETRERYGNDYGQLIERAGSLSEEEFRQEVFGEPVAAPVAPVAPVKPASEGSGSAAT